MCKLTDSNGRQSLIKYFSMALKWNSLFLVVLLTLNSGDAASGFFNSYKDSPMIHPESIMVTTGERIEANCTSGGIPPPFSIRWQLYGNSSIQQEPLRSHKINNSTEALLIAHAKLSDSGLYVCILADARGRVFHKHLDILVTPDKPLPNDETLVDRTFCTDNMFMCNMRVKIFCRYRCNGQVDCPNGADEKGCPNTICVGKFRCNNSRCIDHVFVCDKKGDNHCGDWSDEDRCDQRSVITDAETADNQMAWLKTTVYTVIACTVGVVIFISIVVIAIFRIKMKRAALRRAYLQAERRRRHQCDAQSSQQGQQMEHEPFISSPSAAQFGNIIVSLNNSIQYVPNTDVSSLIQAPPPYSEVIAESRQGRHSPPPEYSTIDRNPCRHSASEPCCDSDQQLVADTDRCFVSRSEHSTPTDTSSVQIGSPRGENTVTSSISDGRIVSPSVTCTNSLGRQSCHSTNLSRNVRLAGPNRRPKQLQVRGGQIVLEGLNTSASPGADIRSPQSGGEEVSVSSQPTGKPGQLQVHGGQILLSTEGCGTAEVGGAGQAAGTAPGQLEVTDGQIMFKAS